MTSEEKSAWTMLVVTIAVYATYLGLLFGRTAGGDVAATPYVDLMIWMIGIAIVANIIISIVWGIARGILGGRNADRVDARDREIHRFGEYVGNGFLIAGALGALILAWLKLDWFWIANVIYLGFVLSAILASITKVISYRRGLPTW